MGQEVAYHFRDSIWGTKAKLAIQIRGLEHLAGESDLGKVTVSWSQLYDLLTQLSLQHNSKLYKLDLAENCPKGNMHLSMEKGFAFI